MRPVPYRRVVLFMRMKRAPGHHAYDGLPFARGEGCATTVDAFCD